MKKVTLILGFLLFAISINAQTIDGLWNTGKENTIVEIKSVGNQFEGTIYSSDNSNAPIGNVIVKDVDKKDDTYKGKIFVLAKKKWYDAEFVRKGNKLLVTVSSGIMKKTTEWMLAN